MPASTFAEYWRERYWPALQSVPGVQGQLLRVVHNLVQPAPVSTDAPPVDWSGIAEMWFADRTAAEAFLTDRLRQQLDRAHAKRLPRILHLPVREVPMWDRGGKTHALKAFGLFVPRAGLTREQAQRYWNIEHVALGTRIGLAQKIAKYVQNHIWADYHSTQERFDYAGASEAWFDKRADAQGAFAQQGELEADEEQFMDRSRATMMIVEEVPVYEKPSDRAS